jgi:hypothetical protein
MSWTGSARDWDDVDCRELALRYLGQPARKTGRAWQWLCPFHADHDTPSFTAYADGYHCFGCAAHGDAVGLVMALERMDYPCAVQHLAAMLALPAANPGLPSRPRQQQRRAGMEDWRRAGWQAATWRLVREAATCLASPLGAPGRDYLADRSIEPATSEAWSLGYVPQLRRRQSGAGGRQVELLGPAITLPWTDGRRVKAVQYRLLEHPQRYYQKAGGDRTLFGVQCLPRGESTRRVLALVEGELNAISIWQAAGSWLDVVSFGPQSNIRRAGNLMNRLSQRYARVVVWADELAHALAAQQAVGGHALAVRSVDGIDANALLVAGQLEAFLAQVLAGWSTPEPSQATGSVAPSARCTPAMGQAA